MSEHFSFKALWLGVALVMAPAGLASANPQGEQVRSGVATFERNGAGLRVLQTSDRAIIHWRDFSIAAGEITQFVQPGAASATLNRVTGALPSSIHGQLRANGKLFLINPNGVLVGPTGRIDAQSFLASTLDVPDAAFLAGGDMNFLGVSQAAVVNQGTINAIGGDVFLLGRSVENHGTINAPQGTVGLGAGQEMLLKQAGDERLMVKPAGAGKSASGVTNTGAIQAASAELKAHGNLYAMAINNQGTIRANGAVKQGGRVMLVSSGGSRVVNTGQISAKKGSQGGEIRVDAGPAGTVENSGKLDAASVTGPLPASEPGNGGTIAVEGGRISLTGAAELNASGRTSGGLIRVGGGFQGRDLTIRNAQETVIGPQVSLRADGGTGAGGRVIIWSDGSTTFGGNISAKSLGAGRGGMAEVSGLKQLDFHGVADLRSARGAAGTLILDPNDAEVNTVATVPGATLITPAVLTNQLNLGSVVVHTSGSDGESGDIHLNAAVSYASLNHLTFAAQDDILVNAKVINEGVAGQGGQINLISGWDGVTGFNATPNTPLEAGTFNVGQIASNPASYGNGGAEILIGSATALASSAVGSRFGETSLFGGSLTLRGTDDAGAPLNAGYAQVGIPLTDAPGAAAGGAIRIGMKEDILLMGGSRTGAYAQIGHGGYFVAAPANPGQAVGGNIAVSTAGNVTLLGGGAVAYAQIGHGGVNVKTSLNGSIAVNAADTFLNAKTSFAQIGHGGQQHNGDKSGALTLTNSGALSIRGDASFARVGHGGSGGSGGQSGDFAVSAASLELLGGNGTGALAQIGHGGPNFTGSAGGNLALNVTGPLVLSAGPGRGAAAQIGHGGFWSAVPAIAPPALSGSIVLTSGGSIDLISGQNQIESYAQIGHGGFRAPGSKSGDISISTTGTGDIFAAAKSSNFSYAQIGHGGTLSGGNATGSIQISAPGRTVTLTNDAANTTAQIGHSGSGTGPASQLNGAITLNVAAVTVDGGFSTGGGALVGHAGGGNLKSGAISVTADDEIRLSADDPAAFAQIGHRNLLAGDPGASGSIALRSDNVLLTQAVTEGAVQAGHFALPGSTSTLSGNIAIDAFTLSLESGDLIGHNGGAAAAGNITSTGESLVLFGASRIGHRSADGERHGNIIVDASTAFVEGVIGHGYSPAAASGDVTVRLGGTLDLYGAIGHSPAALPDYSPAEPGKTWVGVGLDGEGELLLHSQAAFSGGSLGELRVYVPLPGSIVFDDGAEAHFNDQTETFIPPGRTLTGFTFGTGPYAPPYRVYYFGIRPPAAHRGQAVRRSGGAVLPGEPVNFQPLLQHLRVAENPPPERTSKGTASEGWEGPVKKKTKGTSSHQEFQTQQPPQK